MCLYRPPDPHDVVDDDRAKTKAIVKNSDENPRFRPTETAKALTKAVCAVGIPPVEMK